MACAVRFLLTLFLFLVLGCGGPARAGTASGAIRGTVQDSTGQSIGIGSVLVSGTQMVGRLNVYGTYSITGIPPGTYVLRTKLLGYRSVEQVVSVFAGRVSVANFKVRGTPVRIETTSPRRAPHGPRVDSPCTGYLGVDTTGWIPLTWALRGGRSIELRLPRSFQSTGEGSWSDGLRRFRVFTADRFDTSMTAPGPTRSLQCEDTLDSVPVRVVTRFDARDTLYHVAAYRMGPDGLTSIAEGTSRYSTDQRLFLAIIRSARRAVPIPKYIASGRKILGLSMPCELIYCAKHKDGGSVSGILAGARGEELRFYWDGASRVERDPPDTIARNPALRKRWADSIAIANPRLVFLGSNRPGSRDARPLAVGSRAEAAFIEALRSAANGAQSARLNRARQGVHLALGVCNFLEGQRKAGPPPPRLDDWFAVPASD